MIPKIINYCWFGGASLGEKEKKCIDSWKKYLPDHEIVLWNEKKFDIHMNAYVEEAYKSKKWAFVSDVARLAILNQVGGIYLDTDVEIIAPIDDLLKKGAFMGIELYKEKKVSVNPGLIIAAEPNNPIIVDILKTYKDDHFLKGNKNTSKYTIVERTTEVLKNKYNLQDMDCVQQLNGITIYPKTYFCPMEYETGRLSCTAATRSIHWFTASWLTDEQRARQKVCKKINNMLPATVAKPLGMAYLKVGAAKDIIKSKGVRGIIERLKN